LPNGIFGALRLRYFGPQPLIENGSKWGDDSLLFNLRAGYRYRDWEFAIELLNLFDVRVNDIQYFYTSRLRGEPIAGIADYHVHPAEPREIRVTLTRHF
jgi:hypothetical protein